MMKAGPVSPSRTLSSLPARQVAGVRLSQAAVPAALAALAAASAWLYHWGGDLHRFIQGIAAYIWLFTGQFAIYLMACYAVLRAPASPPRRTRIVTLAIILISAAAFRAELADKRPYLSTDTYRYIWDGRVQAAGINPYRHLPAAPELAHLREENIYPRINRGDYEATPYPPIAQAVYLAVYLIYPLSVTAFKVAMSVIDLLTVAAIMAALARSKLDPARAIIFAWHPLLIFEGAHSGHVESVFICFLTLALLAWSYNRHALTGILLALAALVKFYPALVLPLFLVAEPREEKGDRDERYKWASALSRVATNKNNLRLLIAFIATVALAYLPYLTVGAGVFGSLPGEVREEGFTGSGTRFFLLALAREIIPVPTVLFLALALAALAGLALWLMLKPKRDARDVARAAVALIGFYLVLTTPRYSWYYAWIIPFLCFAPRMGWLYLTGASVLLYLLWYTPLVYPGIPLWLGFVIYAPALAWLAWERARERTKAEG
jgi:alpha-1,6-mannosyltransferase